MVAQADIEVITQTDTETATQEDTKVTTQVDMELPVHTGGGPLYVTLNLPCPSCMLIIWNLDYGSEKYKYFILSVLFIIY